MDSLVGAVGAMLTAHPELAQTMSMMGKRMVDGESPPHVVEELTGSLTLECSRRWLQKRMRGEAVSALFDLGRELPALYPAKFFYGTGVRG